MTFLLQILLALVVVVSGWLWHTSAAFRYRAKFLGYYSIVLLTGVFVIIILGPLRGRDIRNFDPVMKAWNVVFKIFGVTPIVRDGHNLASDKPCVIVSNHQSSFDVMGMMAARIYATRCSALGKKALLYAGTFGYAAWLCELVFVDRLNREKARQTMENTARLLHERNLKMWVFPEGTRNLKKGILPFKKGAFHLAIQAQIPIVPVVFSTYEHFMTKSPKQFNTGRFLVTCLPPISTKGMTSDDCAALADKVHGLMLDTYLKSSLEIQEAEKAAGRKLLVEY